MSLSYDVEDITSNLSKHAWIGRLEELGGGILVRKRERERERGREKDSDSTDLSCLGQELYIFSVSRSLINYVQMKRCNINTLTAMNGKMVSLNVGKSTYNDRVTPHVNSKARGRRMDRDREKLAEKWWGN